jgi:hypothetical protein
MRFSMRSTYGFGRNLASLRSQAIDFEFLKDKFPKYFVGKSKVPFIIHISLINYLDDMLYL